MHATPQNYNAYLKSRAWPEKREVRMAKMMGSVYILVNKSMPGWVKVGRTQGLASQHARRMTRKTGVSEPFEVAYEVRCQDSDELEWSMHDKLQEYRRPGQTFYAYPIDYEYSVENAIWMLEKLHFPHLSIDAAILLLERLHFDFEETVTLIKVPSQKTLCCLARQSWCIPSSICKSQDAGSPHKCPHTTPRRSSPNAVQSHGSKTASDNDEVVGAYGYMFICLNIQKIV